jgi:hypothetical protein
VSGRLIVRLQFIADISVATVTINVVNFVFIVTVVFFIK